MDPFAGARRYADALVLFGRGLVVVAVVWGGILAVRVRQHGIRAAIASSAPEALIAMSLVAIWAFTVAPLLTYPPADAPQHLPLNLVPVVPLIQGLLQEDGWRYAGPNLIGNVLLYAPLGLGLRWRFGLGLRWVIALAAGLSLSVEAWQAVSDQMRSSDVNDVLLNTTEPPWAHGAPRRSVWAGRGQAGRGGLPVAPRIGRCVPSWCCGRSWGCCTRQRGARSPGGTPSSSAAISCDP